MNLCRYCKEPNKNLRKLSRPILNFVKLKVANVTENDLFCGRCYMKLKIRYQELKKHKSLKLRDVTSTTEQSTDTSGSFDQEGIVGVVGMQKQNVFGEADSTSLKRQHGIEIQNSRSFESILLSQDSNFDTVNEKMLPTVSSIIPTHSATKSNTRHLTHPNVTVRKNKTTEKSNSFRSVVKPIVANNISSKQAITPSKLNTDVEEIEYDISDDDIIDPGIRLPKIQPHVKRRKVLRSKDEPLNWSYKNGG